MSEIYFTVTGTCYYHGTEFIEPQMKVRIEKEPDNKRDTEAIKVMLPGIGQIGYVANSTHTVQGESMSAGRIYDKIGDEAFGTVLYKLPSGLLCLLDEESVIGRESETSDDGVLPGAVKPTGEPLPGSRW